MEIFAKNIRYLRKEKKLSQGHMAKKVFASRCHITLIEKHKKVPSLALAERISHTLESDLHTLTTIDLTAA